VGVLRVSQPRALSLLAEAVRLGLILVLVLARVSARNLQTAC
jgi:hypothetical protein